VTTRSDRSVIVIGAVAKQGLIKLDCDDTMVGVLAKAGGVAERPSSLPGRTIMPREARVLRDGNLALIDLDPLLNGLDAAADIAVAPGDIIQVQPGDLQTVVVLGEVARPGPVTMAPGMDFMQVIALAGGPTEDAKPSEACVVRGWWKADGAQLLPINLDKVMYEAGDNTPGLRDRDLIIVPRSGIAAMGYFLEKVSPALNTIVLIKALAQ
jgi:polysaccharide export outer membrane protein